MASTWKPRSVDVLALGVGIWSAIILFILVAFDGVRVNEANNAVYLAALSINILGFGISLSLRSKVLAILNGFLLMLFLGASAWGTLECFCMGGGCSNRYDNCAGTYTPMVGLLNALVIAAQNGRLFTLTSCFTLFAYPVTSELVRDNQLRAIQHAAASYDLRLTCIIRVESLLNGWPNFDGATRIIDASAIKLKRPVGEDIARFILVKEDRFFIWRYAAKAFEPMRIHTQGGVSAEISDVCSAAA